MTLDHLYLRYFNTEVLVANAEEALDFLSTIPDITVDENMAKDLRNYYTSKLPYPKRYKVNQRCYFIVIKTNAKTLEEFKNHPNQKANNDKPERLKEKPVAPTTYRPGWYDVKMTFKRVVAHPTTGKCSYEDTDFQVRIKAHSVQECFNRVCDHLRNRHDVDPRSQFPSIRGKNFTANYIGMK